MALDRRRFCKITGATLLTFAGRPALTALGEILPEESPLKAGRWAMVLDTRKCIEKEGCRECIVSCHKVHNVPEIGNPREEVKWIWKETFGHAFPEQEHEYLSRGLEEKPVLVFCNHCDNPPCVRVCPTQATWKRKDGIVMMDWHRCIGCRYCVAACPYGSRSFNWKEPRPFIKEVYQGFPTRQRGVVEKCTFCDERLARGQMPACVEACPDKALVFGDITNAGSEVRALLEERFALRRKPELGTKPQIFYIV